jgi:hypothetical protein
MRPGSLPPLKSSMPATFITNPPNAITITVLPSTDGGAAKRCTASANTPIEIAISAAAFAAAARISVL